MLLQLVHEWLSILDERGSVDAIFLDFAKAFDKVSHPHLLLKLQHYGIKGQLLEWFSDFLTKRIQRVVRNRWLCCSSILILVQFVFELVQNILNWFRIF